MESITYNYKAWSVFSVSPEMSTSLVSEKCHFTGPLSLFIQGHSLERFLSIDSIFHPGRVNKVEGRIHVHINLPFGYRRPLTTNQRGIGKMGSSFFGLALSSRNNCAMHDTRRSAKDSGDVCPLIMMRVCIYQFHGSNRIPNERNQNQPD